MKKKIIVLILLLAGAWFVSNNYYQIMLIQGQSMEPAFHQWQLVVLEKHTENLEYGDVIAFQCKGLNSLLVKRIVGMPGDVVQIIDGVLNINGNVSKDIAQNAAIEYAGTAEEPLTLKEHEFFVIGDNHKYSKDSRYDVVGIICEENIIGKILR